jgi:hypothetical protein
MNRPLLLPVDQATTFYAHCAEATDFTVIFSDTRLG